MGNGTPFGIALHENNGMFGLILVEPTEDCAYKSVLGSNVKEFYIFEQDIYYSETATLYFDEESMLEGESPDYVVYNGRVGSLVDFPLKAEVGKHAIIYHRAAG